MKVKELKALKPVYKNCIGLKLEAMGAKLKNVLQHAFIESGNRVNVYKKAEEKKLIEIFNENAKYLSNVEDFYIDTLTDLLIKHSGKLKIGDELKDKFLNCMTKSEYDNFLYDVNISRFIFGYINDCIKILEFFINSHLESKYVCDHKIEAIGYVLLAFIESRF